MRPHKVERPYEPAAAHGVLWREGAINMCVYIYVYIYTNVYICIYIIRICTYIHIYALAKWSAHMNLPPPMAPYGGQEPRWADSWASCSGFTRLDRVNP